MSAVSIRKTWVSLSKRMEASPDCARSSPGTTRPIMAIHNNAKKCRLCPVTIAIQGKALLLRCLVLALFQAIIVSLHLFFFGFIALFKKTEPPRKPACQVQDKHTVRMGTKRVARAD